MASFHYLLLKSKITLVLIHMKHCRTPSAFSTDLRNASLHVIVIINALLLWINMLIVEVFGGVIRVHTWSVHKKGKDYQWSQPDWIHARK